MQDVRVFVLGGLRQLSNNNRRFAQQRNILRVLKLVFPDSPFPFSQEILLEANRAPVPLLTDHESVQQVHEIKQDKNAGENKRSNDERP